MIRKEKGDASLDEQKFQAITALADVVNQHDGIALKLNLRTLKNRKPDDTSDFFHYIDGVLVGFLAVFQFNSQEVEISGMVHPDYRRQGIFSLLMEQAKREIIRRGIPKLIFIVQGKSQSGKAFVESIGATYSFSEYSMTLQARKQLEMKHPIRLELARPEDREFVAEAMHTAFHGFSKEDSYAMVVSEERDDKQRYVIYYEQERVGSIAVSFPPTPRTAFVYGFCMIPTHQGRGYGRQALMMTVQQMIANGYDQIELEVACENATALGLYQSCGFQVENANDYYVERIELA